jgi:septal ring factor EnvC (AmiA/AmiB activator)
MLRRSLDSLEASLKAVEEKTSRIGELNGTVATLEKSLADAEKRAQAQDAQLKEVTESEKTIREERDGLATTIAEQRKRLAEVQERADELNAQLTDHSLIAAEVQMKKDKQIIRELKGELQRYRDFFATTGVNPDAKSGLHRRTPSGKLPPPPPNMTPDETKARMAQLSRGLFELETRCKQLEAEATNAKEELESWKSEAVQGYVGLHKTHLNAAAPAAGVSTPQKTPQKSATPSPAPASTPGKKALSSFVAMFKPGGGGAASPRAIPEEFAARVQSVLEETLLKNVQMQNDMAMLGAECDNLLKHTRALERRLREAGIEVPDRPHTEPQSSSAK